MNTLPASYLRKILPNLRERTNIILIHRNPWYISRLPREAQTDRVVKKALSMDGSTIQFVKDRTLERCNMAMDNHPNAWKYL